MNAAPSDEPGGDEVAAGDADQQRGSRRPLHAILVATAYGLAGVVLSALGGLVAVLLLPWAGEGAMSLPGFVVLFVASYAGMLGAVWLFLRRSGRDASYLDVEWPGVRDVGYGLLGFVGGFAALLAVGWLVSLLDLSTTPNAVLEPGLAGDTTYLLVLIPLVLLVNAPAEELLYRNVVQKSLYGHFSKPGAVVLASAVFAVVHLPAYFNPNLGATGVSLAVVFVGSLVFGWVYARTDNVVVPAVVHGLFNAVQIALLYVYLTADPTLVG